MPLDRQNTSTVQRVYFVTTFALILLSGLFPLMYALGHQDPFLFVNAWDEETYLTLPAGFSLRQTYGYYNELLVLFFIEKLDISGSYLNLLSDLLLFPGTLALTALVLRCLLKIDLPLALFYTSVIFFAGLMVNYSNPIIFEALPERGYYPIAFGWERMPSLIRTPNPQWTYFIITLIIYLTTRFRSIIFGLTSITLISPVLYPFTAIAGLFLLCQYAGVSIARRLSMPSLGLANVSYLIFSSLAAWAGMGISFLLLKPFFEKTAGSNVFYVESHAPILSAHALLGIIIMIFFFSLSILKTEDLKRPLVSLWIAILLAMLALTNSQVFSGYHPAMKNLIDYGLYPIFGIFLVLSIEIVRHHSSLVFRIVTTVAPLALVTAALHADNFDFKNFTWRVHMVAQISPDDLERVRAAPCHAVVTDRNLAAKLSYGLPIRQHLPFAYQQQFSLPGGDSKFHSYVLSQLRTKVTDVQWQYLTTQNNFIQANARNRQNEVDRNALDQVRCTLSDLPDPAQLWVVPLTQKPGWAQAGITDLFR